MRRKRRKKGRDVKMEERGRIGEQRMEWKGWDKEKGGKRQEVGRLDA